MIKCLHLFRRKDRRREKWEKESRPVEDYKIYKKNHFVIPNQRCTNTFDLDSGSTKVQKKALSKLVLLTDKKQK